MKISQPLGNASYAPLLLRLPLGAYFVLAGWGKLNLLAAFVEQVKKMNVLSDNLAALYGALLPYLEIYIGVALFLGLWTTLSALLSSLLLFSFVFAFGFFPGDNGIFNKDVVLLGASLSLLYSGAGAYSIDNVRKASTP